MPFESKQSLPRVRYTLECAHSPATGWQVRRVAIAEGLSRPYEIVVDLRVPLANGPELDVDALLAANAELGIERDSVLRTLCGVIRRVELRDPLADQLPVRLWVVPALALLEQRVDTRLWQHMTAIEVVQEVLAAGFGDYGRELDLSHLSKTYPVREYIVQYDESDFALVSRLLEDEGVSYQFDHERGTGAEVLVLEDSSDHWTEVPSLDGDPSLRVIQSRSDQAEIESLQQLTWTRAMQPTSVVRRTFDWLWPTSPIDATVLDDDVGPNREVYHHGRIVEPNPDVRAARELAHARAGSRALHGIANAVGLAPGRRFRVVAGDRPELDDREFLVTRLETRGDCPDVELGVGQHPSGSEFEVEFDCVALDGSVWQPPLRTRIPNIHGPQTAIVTGPEGEEIHTDEYGRVKVRFDWDRVHALTDDSSMWIRVAHGWAGSGFGVLFTPRIGMEVVVEFIGGAPERPLITGCVYNGEALPSIVLPDSKTQSGIRTLSSPGGGGFNELRFEDAAGAEQIYVHAQRDSVEQIGRNSTSTIGSHRTETVGGNCTQTVRGDQTVTIENNRVEYVQGIETLVIDQTRDTTVLLEDSLYVGSATVAVHEGGVTRRITGSDVTVVSATESPALSQITVNGNHEVTASHAITLTATERLELVQGEPACAQAKLEGGQVHIRTDAELRVEAATEVTLAGNNSLSLRQGDMTMMVLVNDNITLTAKTLTIRADTVDIDGGGTSLVLDAMGLKIGTPGTVEITGSIVKVN